MKRKIAALGAGVALLSGGVTWTAPALAADNPACVKGAITITRLGYNAPGTDKPANRNAEYVRLSNTGELCSLKNWRIHDNYKTSGGDWGNVYTFSEFSLGKDKLVYVYNGAGVIDEDSIYRNVGHHFNNSGDTIYLETADGTVADKVTYDPFQFWAPLP